KDHDLRAELAQCMAAAPVKTIRWAGEYVEIKFAIAALEEDLRLAKPTSGCLPWDWMILGRKKFYRVQVRHTTAEYARGYRLALRGSQDRYYQRGDFDVLAVLAAAPGASRQLTVDSRQLSEDGGSQKQVSRFKVSRF